jgi:type IV secretory pathway protease TraF
LFVALTGNIPKKVGVVKKVVVIVVKKIKKNLKKINVVGALTRRTSQKSRKGRLHPWNRTRHHFHSNPVTVQIFKYDTL